MLIEQQPAFVLHARAYRETSLLLECLTRDFGRIGVVARGVRGSRAKVSRSELEPFQLLHLDVSRRGELATLRGAEPVGQSRRLHGELLLAGLYLNELIVRLSARDDAQSGLFELYRTTLSRLDDASALAWTLRRFERDVLAELGYALELTHAAGDGAPIDAVACYRYVPEHGPQPCASGPGTIRGSALLALAADRVPEPSDLRDLRRLMREQIAFHLGGGELHAWRMLRASRSGR